jgi:hypothetical protein
MLFNSTKSNKKNKQNMWKNKFLPNRGNPAPGESTDEHFLPSSQDIKTCKKS